MSRRGISRRNATAGGVAMLVLAGAAAGQARAEELDCELLKLCQEFTFLCAETDRLGVIAGNLNSRSLEGIALDAKITPMVSRIHALRDEISDIPAKTPEGLRAKARTALNDLVPCEEWHWDNSTWMAISVLEDMLGRAEA